jgi:antitoxin component HigA of HigAB toxin-antitoxin module
VQQGILESKALKLTVPKTWSPRKRQPNGRRAPAYLALIEHFQLRPFRTEGAYEVALGVLDSLALREMGSLDSGEQDNLDTLRLQVEAYDREHVELESQSYDPLTMLKYVVQEGGMTQADLWVGF